jgi:uncharacterized protein YndB with AHSA1/START domain
MRMQVTHHLNGDVDQVFALMTDPKFLERKFAAGGAKEISVDHEKLADGTCRVTTRRHVTVDLPGFAKRFIQPTNSLLQTETWEQAGPGQPRTCRYRVDVQGVPSHIDGTVTLTPDGTGTRQDIEATVKVSIPIVGGKLERLAVDSGQKLLADEAAFTNQELAG